MLLSVVSVRDERGTRMSRALFALLCLAAFSAHADILINAGGESTDGYSSDRYFSGGNTWRYSAYTGIYDTERYSAGGTFKYNIPVTPGAVEVTLLFRESCVPCATRSSNINAEGQRVLSNVTVPAHTYVERVFTINSDATLNLEFITVSGEAFVNGIRVRELGGSSNPPPPTVALSANPTSVTSGSSSTLTWSSSGATSCTASGSWSGSRATSGTASTGALTANSSYTLTCSNLGGSTARTVSVAVTQTPPPPSPPTVSLSANPTSVTSGSASTLTWTSSGATSCTASGAWSGSRSTSGSTSTGPLTANSSYTLTCSNSGGSTARTATVSVTQTPPPPSPPTVSLSANPTSVNSGSASTLTWSSSGATSCTASGAWSGSRSTSGSTSTGALSSTSTYTLSCSNSGGSTSRSATVTVVSQPPPTVTLTANPTTVDVGNSSTLTWSSTNASSCTASGAWSGSRATSGTASTGSLSSSSSYTLTCTGAGSASSTQLVTVRQPGAAVAFPLNRAPNRRYLIDANGQPFLLHGDTPWSLISDLSREDAELYLQDRAARGFNTLLVNLIDHQFARNAPRNYYNAEPFTTPGNFSTPNEAYFAHADWVLGRARDLGFVVLLVPAYLGYGGGGQGWYSDLVSNSNSQLLAYGRFLGQRYRSFDNIIWTHGGDYNPPNRNVVRQIAAGIREYDADVLTTTHNAPESAAMDYWGSESWLTLNNVYTYGAVYSAAYQQYARSGPVPFFFIEGAYEYEQGASTVRLRTQAYHAVLSGAAGQLFGNNPIWHFNGPGIYSAPVTWKQALNSPGSQSMTRLKQLFDTVDWWTMEPDTQARLLTAGASSGQDRAVASLASDGSFALAYIPTIRTNTFNLNMLAGPRVSARWYDPSNGTYTTATGSPFNRSSAQTFRAPRNNAAGSGDWVLILQSVP
jgi:hypothetical protein